MLTELAFALALVGLIVAGALVAGMVALFRNREGAKPTSAAGLPALSARASVLLVALDESLAAADNELGFAIAQFGEAKTRDYAAAVADARTAATTAFRLRRELEDAFPETVITQREMTLQIIALSEKAQKRLDSQDRSFSSLRSAELEAPASLTALTDRISAASERVAGARKTLARLAKDYRPAIEKEYARSIEAAVDALDEAQRTVATAEKQVSPTGVNAVVGDLRAAEQQVGSATTLLDSVDAVAAQLDAAAQALATLVAAQKTDLAEARRQRESAPDADTGAAIVDAIDSVEKTLAAVAKQKDPIEALDRLGAAVAELDTALASARNQTQRLEHARTALAGALVSARSQITAARGFMAAGGRGVGAAARGRLREAEQQLEIAEAEADPVEALDAARRAATHARDADALARYDAAN